MSSSAANQLYRFAADATVEGTNCDPATCNTGLPIIQADNENLQHILDVTFGVIAAITVIVIVVAGIRMIVSVGDAQAVTRLRKTIMYSAIGLVAVLTADIIVSLVLNRL